MLFVVLFTTLVYNPVAYWTWGARGWLRNLACLDTIHSLDVLPCGIGSYDYAGGGPVHVTSGFAALAYCLIIGPRRRFTTDEFKPHNLTNVFLGTALLWFGWLGFNGGSAIASTPRAALAAFVTVISASVSGLTWTLIDYSYTGKWSGLGFCSGVVSGLVTITPGSGFVSPWAAIIFGLISGVTMRYGIQAKSYFGFDDSLDAFGIHAIGGCLGNILTGFFASKWIGSFDTSDISGGWIDGHYIQLWYQVVGTVAIAVYSFCMSYALLYLVNLIPGLQLRTSLAEEELGADLGQMGELSYDALPTVVQDMVTNEMGRSTARRVGLDD